MDTIAIGIVRKQHDVLIIRRAKPETSTHLTKLFWAFPGGRPEEGESLKQAVIREVKEETGLDINILQELSHRQHPQFPVEIYYFAAEPINPNQPLQADGTEVAEARWVSPGQLERYFTTHLSRDVAAYLQI